MKRDRDFEYENPKHAFVPLISKKVVKAWAKVSFEHYEEISKHNWYLTPSGYVVAKAKIDGKSSNLHQFVYKNILQNKVLPGQLVDHIDRDRLNNTTENLRTLTVEQNARNRTKKPNSSSLYYNVIAMKNKFLVSMELDGKTICVGNYKSEKRAAEMRDIYLLKKFTDFESTGYNLNFPERKEEFLNTEFKNDIKRTKSSMYIGVSKRNSELHPFQAKAKLEDKIFTLGNFKTEIEAAKVYDAFIMKHKLDRKLNLEHPNYVHEQKIHHKSCVIENYNTKTGIVVGSDVVIIDNEDYDRVKYGSIYKSKQKDGYIGYRIRFRGINKRYTLARFICNITDSNIWVDHLDSDTKNNSKSNLDVCLPAGNNEGRKKVKTASSQFYGVRKSAYNYRTVVIHQEKKYSAYFKSEHDAAIANDLYVILHLQNTKKRKNFDFWTAEKLESERLRINSLLPNEQNML